MAYTETFAQEIGVVDVLNSQTLTNASVSTLGVNMTNARRVKYTIVVPSLGAAGTLDGRLQASNSSSFTAGNVTNLQGTNLTQINTTTTPSNNAIAEIEVRADQLQQANNAYQYVRLNLTGGGNPITVLAVGMSKDTPQRPISQYNLNSTFLSQQQACTL